MDQWHVVSEGRCDGVLCLTVRKGRAYAYRSVAYYDEFTEQSVFRAVARGHTDPRTYCMGCGADEGALHEHWCHAVKEAHRKKAEHRQPVNMDDALARRAVNHRAFGNEYHWSWITCIDGVWFDAEYGFKHAQCPNCKGTVVAPEPPQAPPSVGEQIRQALAERSGPRPTHATGVNESHGRAVSWWLTGCKAGVKLTASILEVLTQCCECGEMVQQPYIPGKDPNPAPPPKTHPTGVNWVGTEVKSWWFWCAKNGLTTTSSANIGEARCLACGVMVQTPGVNFYMHGRPENSWLPGKEPPAVETAQRRMERTQPSAVSQAKAFHLRPPRREIVVLVDDQSEPP